MIKVFALVSRIVRALASSESSMENIRDAQWLKRKLVFTRKTSVSTLEVNGQAGVPASISRSWIMKARRARLRAYSS